MKLFKNLLFSLLALLLLVCTGPALGVAQVAPNFTEAVFLQVNDVYEIGALDNGKKGGLARVATVLQKLKAENPNTYFIICGDFLNPSVIGTMKHEGKTIKGKQMVDVMNYIRLDYAILGNHEFDLDFPEFQERVNESQFKWISTDVNGFENVPFSKKDKDGYFIPFTGTEIIKVPGKNKKEYKIGLFSATIPLAKKNWVTYNNYLQTSVAAARNLSASCNVVVGLTHLEIRQDRELAKSVPFVPLFMGGHDHDNMMVKEGNTVITKADANARSVYIHRIRFDDNTDQVKVISESVNLDEKIVPHEGTTAVVNKWKNIAWESMTSQGFEPDRVVRKLEIPLDGRESVVRNGQCKLGNLITASMMAASKEKAVCAFFNSGSIRVDDIINGNLTEYDILRIMPYGGPILDVSLKGNLLKKVLDAGEENAGKGGYLQRSANVVKNKHKWQISGKDIDDAKVYNVVTGSFLFSGKEAGLAFFNDKNPDVLNISNPSTDDKSDVRNDFRRTFIRYMENKQLKIKK